MREKADTKENSSAVVTHRAPWTVVGVRVLGGHRLWIRFVDGTEGEADVSRLVFGRDPGVFKVLRDPDLFARVGIDQGAVTWPGGLDLAPDAMYDEIRANGRWTAE
ncbi:MAG: DUF2442 domain-containing protein [Gemmatimonadaceae bacterium]